MTRARGLPKRSLFYITLGAALLVIGAVALVIKVENKPSPTDKIAKIRNTLKQDDLANLKNGNITAYQNSQLNYVDDYMAAHDYKAAAAVLGDIKKNVPEKQWDVDTYMQLAQLAKAQGKDADYKNYTNKLIDKLNAGGDSDTAKYYQKQLQSN